MFCFRWSLTGNYRFSISVFIKLVHRKLTNFYVYHKMLALNFGMKWIFHERKINELNINGSKIFNGLIILEIPMRSFVVIVVFIHDHPMIKIIQLSSSDWWFNVWPKINWKFFEIYSKDSFMCIIQIITWTRKYIFEQHYIIRIWEYAFPTNYKCNLFFNRWLTFPNCTNWMINININNIQFVFKNIIIN